MPTITNLVYTQTDTTIVATWDTNTSADSHFTAGAKLAVDDGYAPNSTSHQCVVTGLIPNTVYSCVVTSGGTSSSPQNVTTNPSQNRIPILSASNGPATAFANTGGGDSLYSFVSSDGVCYCTQNDGHGLTGSANAGANSQLCKFTNNTTLAGADVNRITSYTPGGSGLDQRSGTDGPSGQAMRAACYGVFGINNHLFMFMSRNNQGGPPAGNWWGNVIMDNADHGTTWNKFTAPGTFNANGVGPCDGVTNADIFEYAVSTYGFNVPVLYAADDGTLGYNTAGNQIDGANAYVYLTLRSDVLTTSLYMMRWPRIAFAAQDNSKVQYWKGPTSPTPADFVSDSNWSLSNSTLTDIHTTATSRQGGRIFFVPTINRYVLLDNVHTANGNTDFYASEAPTPAGPWTQFFTQNNNPQGWIVPAFMHADLIANSSTDNISIRMLYAGDFTNPTYYQPHSSSLVIKTTMPIPSTNTPIQGNGWHAAASSSTPTSLAFTGNITSGNLLVVAWRHASGCAVTAVKDSANGVGVPWTIVYDTSDASSVFGGWAYLFSTVTSVSPPTVSLTLSGTPAGVVMAIEEWNGPQFVRGVSAASTTLTSPALASPLAGDLLIGVCSVNTSTAINAGSSYTIRQTAQNLTSAFFVGIEDNLNAAGGSTTASFTAPGSVDFTSGIGAFYGFAPTFSISGNAGVAGATVSYSGTASGSVTADGSGNYSISNLNAGPYTITPVLNGYSFSPANSAQTIISANITGVNFTGTFVGFTIPSLGGSLNQSLFELYGLTTGL